MSKSKRIDPSQVAGVTGSLYPAPFDEPCRTRERRKLGDAAGLTEFGVNLLRLPPNSWSSQRHWHERSDEFVYVLAGEVVVVSDGGEETLRAGECAGFKANDGDGHCLQNRSGEDALVLEVGTRDFEDTAHYPDIDLVAHMSGKPALFTRRDGTPYPSAPRQGPEDKASEEK